LFAYSQNARTGNEGSVHGMYSIFSKNYKKMYDDQLLIIFVERIDTCQTRTILINLQTIILKSSKASIKVLLFFL